MSTAEGMEGQTKLTTHPSPGASWLLQAKRKAEVVTLVIFSCQLQLLRVTH